MLEIAKSIKRADEDREVKVLVITGAGDKAFCVGASIDQIEQESILMNKRHGRHIE